MGMPQDLLEGMQRQMAEQTAAFEAAHKANVNRFVELWLTLGADVMKLDGTRHDAELVEAKGLAATRWNRLIGMESQAEREAAALARRPKERPSSATDDTLPYRTIEKLGREWRDQTKYLGDSLAALKAEAASERRLLESYITKAR